MTKTLVLMMLLGAGVGVLAQPATAPSPMPGIPLSGDYYAAGNRVDVRSPVDGDVVIAGRVLTITRPVSGDVLAAGWRVTLDTSVTDDVRIAAAEVAVNGAVKGDLTIAGGDVAFGPQTRVTGRTWLTGGNVRTEGVLERQVHIAAGTVQIAGEIKEPVDIVAERLEILPTARVVAPLTYRGPTEARVAQGAMVTGPITYHRVAATEARRARWFGSMSSALFALHLAIAGLLFLILFPRFAASAVETLRAEPGRSLLAGFALLVIVPVAALLLVVSVLGIPLGLTLAAVYGIALFLGILTTAMYVGDVEARLLNTGPLTSRAQQRLMLLAGVVTLALLRSVPLVGSVVVFAAIVSGLGALALWTYRLYTRTAALQPAPGRS